MKTKITYIILLFTMTSCAEEWLDIKQDKKMVVPESLSDLEALLNNTYQINYYATPMLGVMSADNIQLTFDEWSANSYPYEKNGYIWADDIYEGLTDYNWNTPYQTILLCNLVLEGLDHLTPASDQQRQYDNIKGSALFYRSWSFFQLAQIFGMQYDEESATVDLGIVLRLESDVNLTSERSTVAETYDQILKDLKEADALLPLLPSIKTKPCQAATKALLAKTFLQMGQYSEALNWAKKALEIQGELMDYNHIDSADYPFTQMNLEVIFQSTMYPLSMETSVPEYLFDSYDSNDLRKVLYFEERNHKYVFKGSYDGSESLFSGIATDELHLIVVECQTRLNNLDAANSTLNEYLSTRYRKDSFVSSIIQDQTDLLKRIFSERQKALTFRGIRWSDLRRMNKDSELAITLSRNLNGTIYELLPNAIKYTLPIPDDVISYSGIPQNPR